MSSIECCQDTPVRTRRGHFSSLLLPARKQTNAAGPTPLHISALLIVLHTAGHLTGQDMPAISQLSAECEDAALRCGVENEGKDHCGPCDTYTRRLGRFTKDGVPKPYPPKAELR